MKKGLTHTERVLNVWGIVLILWSGYRFFFKTDLGIWIDEFIAKPLIFIVPVYWFVTKNEKRPFFESIGLKSKSLFTDILIGLGLGSIFFLGNAFIGVSQLKWKPQAFLLIGAALATSISQEIVSRGFVLDRLFEESKNALLSPVFASVLFFLLNVPMIFTTPTIAGAFLIKTMILEIVLSLALSYLYLYRRSLFIPIIVYALYSLSIYLSI